MVLMLVLRGWAASETLGKNKDVGEKKLWLVMGKKLKTGAVSRIYTMRRLAMAPVDLPAMQSPEDATSEHSASNIAREP
jgi:hypothetical protein